jgi:hypothetical protein
MNLENIDIILKVLSGVSAFIFYLIYIAQIEKLGWNNPDHKNNAHADYLIILLLMALPVPRRKKINILIIFTFHLISLISFITLFLV